MTEKRKIKINHRIISFLLCLVVLFTFTVHAPIHQPKAFAIEATLTALLLGLLTACGVQIITNNQNEIDAITQDVWSYMTQDRAYVKNTIEGYVNQVQHQYDPFTNTYIKSKFTIGTQEYMDIHEAVNSWAEQNIIEGQVNINGMTIKTYAREDITNNDTFAYDTNNTTWKAFQIELNTPYSINYYRTSTNYGKLLFKISLVYHNQQYKTIEIESKIYNEYNDSYTDYLVPQIWISNLVSVDYFKITLHDQNPPLLLVKYLDIGSNYKYINHGLYNQSGLTKFHITNPTIVGINVDAEPLWVPLNNNAWPYEIKQKWHLDNIENPTGTGEKEFTIDVENPYTNTVPTNVLPKDLTDGITFPGVGTGTGTIESDVTDIKNAVVTLSDTLADSISGAIDSINKMPFLPRITLSLMLFALLILMLIIACIFLVIRCIAWIGLMLVVPASAVGIDDDIMWGIQYAFDFNIADIITVRQLFTLMVSIFFGLSIIRYASKIKVNHT